MSTAEAMRIFNNCFKDVEKGNINANLDTSEDILTAIHIVAVHLATHNSVSKDSILNALRWVLEEWVLEEEQDV